MPIERLIEKYQAKNKNTNTKKSDKKKKKIIKTKNSIKIVSNTWVDHKVTRTSKPEQRNDEKFLN